MSRTVFRTLTGAFALVAATALISLGSTAGAAEDGIVIGGRSRHTSRTAPGLWRSPAVTGSGTRA